MQIINVVPNTPEWLEVRKQGLGGSDCAAALGLSKWKTPYQLWQEKRGESEPEPENEAMYWGKVHEQAIRQKYSNSKGLTVDVPQGILVHDTYTFMRYSPDGVAEGRLFEAKTSRRGDGWGEPGTDEVPQEYLMQVQHGLIVTGLEVADVSVLIGGSEYREYEVPADKELQGLIIEAEHDFWQRVQSGVEPELTGSDVEHKFRQSKPGIIQAGEHELDLFVQLKAARDARKSYEEKEEELTAQLKRSLGEFDTLAYGAQTLATWKSAAGSKRFDAAAFKQFHPELYEQFVKQTDGSRRFLIK